MYKVFIENNPIYFLSKEEEIPSNSIVLYLISFKSVGNTFDLMLKNIQPNLNLVLVCDELESFFKLFFEVYDYIEAAGGIVQRKETLLFIERNGYWDIPKGKIEKGESVEAGAIREVEEECGIQGPVIDYLICETLHTYLYKDKPVLKKTFWFKMSFNGSKNLIPQTEEGITKVEWLSKKDFSKISSNTFESIKEVLNIFKLQMK